MAISAFGDELDDSTAAGPVAPKPPAPQAPRLSAFGDSFDDEAPAQSVPAAQPQQTGIMGLLSGLMTGNANNLLPDGLRQKALTLDDYGLSLSKGMLSGAEGIVGLGDIATGGRVSPGLKAAYGYDPAGRRAELDRMATPEHQQAMQQLDRAQGISGTLQALRDNPSLVPHAIVESAPSMILGGGIGRGVALGAKGLGASGGLAGLLGTGGGEGLVAAGQQASQTVQDNEAKGTPGLTLGQTGLAIGSGLGTGLLGMAGARIGRKLGVMDIDAQLAGAGGVDVARSLVQRALVGTGLESLEELTQSGQQQVLSNLAQDRPAMEGVTKQMVLGGVVGGAMGGAAGLRRPNMNTPVEQPPVAPTATQQAEAMATPAPAPVAQQPAPQPVPFAGSQDVRPLFRSMGMDEQQMDSSLALLRPDEPSIEAARRGKMTWEETGQLADLAGTTIAKMKARRLGQPLNAEDHLAATRLLQQQTTRTLDLANKMSELSNAGKSDDAVASDFMLALDDLRTAQSAVMGSRAELGRALNIQRMNVQTGRRATALLEAVGGIDKAKDMADALVNAARSGGVKSANKLATKAGTDMFWTYYKAALLSGPDTHIVNSASNLANALLNIPTRGVAGLIGTGKRAVGLQGETYLAEPAYQIRGFVDGISSGARAFTDSWSGRETEYEASTNAKNDVYRSDMLGQKYWGVPLRALGAADAFFKAINFGMETYSLAYRTAASEGLEGDALGARVKDLVANPTEKMKENIKAAAEFQTFTDKSGVVINMLNGAKNRIPLGLGNIPAPFFKTPGKILAYNVKHTPLLTYLLKDSREAYKAGDASHEQVLARQAIGTLIYSLGALGAAAGVLSGAGPQDDNARKAWLAAGNQPLSIKIGGEWYSYARIEPFATLLGISADVYQNYQDGDATAAAFTKAISGNFLSKTWLQGLSKAMQAITDPDRYGAGWVNSTAATLVNPWTIGAQAARIGDDYKRQADYKSFTDQLKLRTPFLRESLPIKLDHFGAPMEENERQWHGLGPITRTKPSDDPVRQEAARLGWAPGRQQDHFTSGKIKHTLTAEQVYERDQVTGQLIHRDATVLMRSKTWQNMDDDQRREALDKVVTRARNAIKVALTPWLTAGKRGPFDRLKSSIKPEVTKK
ncbi:hypothetical protein [Pseudomonas sp. NBRC 111140]|uniref:hypothetical protein n=1 Tax=Pseudomonas sp. NBRC 111140 TaxID=1661055 RepID=UPI000761A850|nr:hypothetical protein [Pseudomonas sp. NBRC 111140]